MPGRDVHGRGGILEILGGLYRKGFGQELTVLDRFLVGAQFGIVVGLRKLVFVRLAAGCPAGTLIGLGEYARE
jgi:hypothetical protein